ncbi:MAG: hypothetical protein NTX70_08005 [Verrucomicrobia bacterium]|nr:hypothetical protein [Verrucomicrobiota bacterium]
MLRASWGLRITAGWLSAGALSIATLWAQLPLAKLNTVFPLGGAAGSSVEVTVSGSDLDAAEGLMFSDPRVTATPVPGSADRFRVHLPAELPEDPIDLRVRGRYGVSNPRAFAVGTPGTELRWTQAPVSPSQAFELPLEVVVNGRVGAQEVLWFRFQGEAGQALGVRVEARELDSKLVADLALTDASGAELARVRRRDRFNFRLPAKGVYFLRLHDSLYRGGDTHGFRLKLTARPSVAFAVPQVLQAGRSQRIIVYGHRLPGGKSSQVLGADGEPLEQRELEITAPAEPTASSALVGTLGQPPSTPLAAESWLWRGSDGVVPVQSVPFGLTALPVVAGTSTGLVSVTTPCEFSALFPARGHSSGVAFEAKKGEVLWVELTSERWGHPVDPMALVQRAKPPAASAKAPEWVDVMELADTERNLGDREFPTAHRDAAARWEVPETGQYRILVRDGFRRSDGTAQYPYRLSLRREAPDFQLVAFPMPPARAGEDRSIPVLPSVLRRDQTLSFRVVVFRRDGFQGDIELSASNLPPGVRASNTRILSDQNTGVLLLSASAEASGAAPWQLLGQASVGSTIRVRTASVASVVWPVADYNIENPVVRRSRGSALGVVTDESAPVTVRVGVATGSADGAIWKLPLQIERRGEFHGAFKLKAVGHAALDKVQEISIPEKATNMVAELSLGEARLSTGTHTLWLQGSLAGKYRQAPEALVSAEAELKAAEQALSAAKPEGKAAAETRKTEAEARRKAAEEKAKPRDLTLAIWSEPFRVTVGGVAKTEVKP